jgi:hypothetical protein
MNALISAQAGTALLIEGRRWPRSMLVRQSRRFHDGLKRFTCSSAKLWTSRCSKASTVGRLCDGSCRRPR